jgi:hypothetical protein
MHKPIKIKGNVHKEFFLSGQAVNSTYFCDISIRKDPIRLARIQCKYGHVIKEKTIVPSRNQILIIQLVASRFANCTISSPALKTVTMIRVAWKECGSYC